VPISVEERLKLVEDQLEIQQLRARYCHLMDDRKWDEFVLLFTEDGLFQGLEAVRGRANLREFFGVTFPAMAEDFYHFCSNGTVTVDGDNATGRITLQYLSVVGGQSYVSAGHYDDTLVRIDGQWKFAARILTFYFLSPLSAGWAGRPFPGRSPASKG
jgi:hypothetical protein